MAAWDEIRAREDDDHRRRVNEFRLDHPHLAEWKEASPRPCRVTQPADLLQKGRSLIHPYHFPPSEAPRASEPVPSGTVRVQVSSQQDVKDLSAEVLGPSLSRRLESWNIARGQHPASVDWRYLRDATDIDKEAYIGMIREANHCIYIENQFCKRCSR